MVCYEDFCRDACTPCVDDGAGAGTAGSGKAPVTVPLGEHREEDGE
jgi:hypothetical protein